MFHGGHGEDRESSTRGMLCGDFTETAQCLDDFETKYKVFHALANLGIPLSERQENHFTS